METSGSRLSRRTLFAGASGVGAVAVAASLVPALRGADPPAAQPVPAPAKGGGYRLSEHIKQYYKSTHV
jgi:hypothetical protein